MDKLLKGSEKQTPSTKELFDRFLGFLSGRIYTHTQFIIEEPEQNLFPETQCELMYHILASVNHGKNHRLVMTTHSPYILFALNNCMMGGLVRDNIPEEDRPTFESYPSWIDPKQVSVYEIQDRTIRCIQDADGIIEDNYLNQAYKDNVNEYVGLLNYYEDEE